MPSNPPISEIDLTPPLGVADGRLDLGNRPQLDIALGINSSVEFQTFIMDRETGREVKRGKKIKNLILDSGLNAFAKSTNSSTLASSFLALRIGGGTNPNSFAGGSVTFSQSGTTLTASSSFFTSAMVGGLFKLGASGSGGAESYIAAFISATQVTMATSTFFTTQNGTVWMVQQTSLQTLLYSTSTYQTNAGDNSTTFAAGVVTFKRTFVNPAQAGTYTVNELGWFSGTGGTTIFGRVVLSSSDVIGPSNFYLVVMTLTCNFSPNVPLAVTNVGTGLNTAGNLMMEWFDIDTVAANGTVNINGGALDSTAFTIFITATYTQQSSCSSGSFTVNVSPNAVGLNSANWTYTPASVGLCTLTSTVNTSTTGQTCFGIGIGNAGNFFHIALDVKLTSTFALPTGVFQPTVVWQAAYTRTLTNP